MAFADAATLDSEQRSAAFHLAGPIFVTDEFGRRLFGASGVG